MLLDPTKWRAPLIDFWTASSGGRFFHRRGLWEDHLAPYGFTRYPSEPMTLLDAALHLEFVAEALVIGQTFARALGCRDTDKIDYSFRWSGLRDRKLISISHPSRLFLLDQPRATDDDAKGHCVVSVNTVPSAVYQYVQEATTDLFLRFDGKTLPLNWIQRVVDDFLQRRPG